MVPESAVAAFEAYSSQATLGGSPRPSLESDMDQVDEYYLDRVVDVAETALVETTEDIVSGCGINLTAKGPASWPRQVDIPNIMRITRTDLHVAASTASALNFDLGSVTVLSMGGRSKLRCVPVRQAAERRRPMKDR